MNFKFQIKLVIMILILIVITSGWFTYQNLMGFEQIFKEEIKEEGFLFAHSVEKELLTTRDFENQIVI